LCSTCTENGHGCLGYAEGGELLQRREKRYVDGNTRRDNHEDDDVDDEEEKHIETGRSDDRSGNLQIKFSIETSEMRRIDAKQQIFNSNPRTPKERDASEGLKPTRPSFQDYRESAVYSDEGTSSLGTYLNVPNRFGY